MPGSASLVRAAEMIDFELTDETAPDPADRARLRRGRDPAAHPRVGRGRRGPSRGLREDGRARASWARRSPRRTAAAGPTTSRSRCCARSSSGPTRRSASSRASTSASNSLALLQWGTEAQRQRWLVPQARGEKLATFGLTEPGVGHRRGEPPVDRPTRRRRLRPERPEDLDLPRGHRGPLPRLRDGRPREGLAGHHGVPRRARHVKGLTTGTLHGKLGHPGGEHRAAHLRGPVRARRAAARRGGRGVPDRDERDRPGPVHGRRRGGRPCAGVPGRVGAVRARAARRSARRSAGTSS